MNTDIHALAGAYVLDAVDELERVAFARHLTECESCRIEVAEMGEAAARLADGTFSVPPPRLRTDVMAAIGRTRQLGPVSATRPERDLRASVSRRRGFALAAAAAVVLAVGAGVTTYTIQDQRVRDQRAIAEAAQQQSEAAQQQSAAAQAEQSRVRYILAAPDTVVRTTTMVGGGRVTVASSASRRASVVVLAARTAPAAGRAFQFWTINGGVPVAGDTLDPGATEAVRVVNGLPGNAVFAVTVEPAGGSSAPTSPAVAKVSLT